MLGVGGLAATAAPQGGTLRIVVPVGGPLPALDPAVVGAADPWGPLWYGVCATLMAFRDAAGYQGLTMRPEAAAGLPIVSPNRRRYVFTLRKGLRFSDGSALRAANFRYAILRVLNPRMQSKGAGLFSDIERVSATGRRLRIDLKRPSGDLLARLALPWACPVPLGFPIEPTGELLKVSSGPYRIARYETGRRIVLERNRKYLGARPHRVDRVVITIDGDVDSDIGAVENERSDVFPGELPFQWRAPLKQRYGVNRRQLFRRRGTYVYFLALNTSRRLFRNNIALRKAVNFALDRTEIMRAGIGGKLSWTPTDQIVPRGIPGWVDHRHYPLTGDLRHAGRLAAGNLRGGKAVLYTSQVPFLVDQAQVIARELIRIGLDVSVIPMAPLTLDAKAGTRGAPFDMVLARYQVEYPDPADVIVHLLGGINARKPTGNTNFAYFDDPAYNRRMAMDERLTGAARLRAFSRLDADLMRRAAPWAPLFEGSSWLFVSKRVGCLKLHPVFRFDLAAMCVR